MESDGENTLVINDLLSFISCKINTVPRSKLFSITKEFYPKNEITQAYTTLLECIPKTYCSNKPKKDLLDEIANLISKLPEEISPIFVCQNINNVPQIKSKPATLTFADLNLTPKQQQELREDHASLQSQISDVSRVVRQLKDQMEILVNKCAAYDRQASNLSESPEKDDSRIDSSPKKGKRSKSGKRNAEDDFAGVSSSSDLQSSLSEAEDIEAQETAIKDCFIPLGRFDDCELAIKKEPVEIEVNGEEVTRFGRRPHRQKYSKFSEDFVVDFGIRSGSKKIKK